MLKYYATLNENKICIGTQSSVLEQPLNTVEITEQEYQNNTYSYRKFENGVWSTDKFELVSTAPIDEFTSIKSQVDALNVAMANLVGGVS